MESKYEQLTKLKQLLDEGALTQEEFEKAKNRILNSEESNPDISQISTESSDNKPSSTSAESSSKQVILWCAVGGLALVILLVVLSSKNDNSYPTFDKYSEPETEIVEETEVVEEKEAFPDYQFEETFSMDSEVNEYDGLTLGNPWRKDYFHNEWGEDILDEPFIYTSLDGQGWNIHIDYILPDNQATSGVFRIYLLDHNYRKTDSRGPVNILVRGSDGETRTIEVTGTRDGITFIEEPSAVSLLTYYLNQETFDIRMEFDKYNERHAAQARWEASPQSFQEAVTKLLLK